MLHVHSGRLTPYAGDYDYYLEKSRATNDRAALTAGFTDARPVQNDSAPRRPAAPARNKDDERAQKAKVRQLRVEVGHLEETVAKLEAQQTELTTALEAPETYTKPGQPQHLNRELSHVVDQLQTATTAWETAAAALAELEQTG